MNMILKFLDDGTGQLSMTRLIMLATATMILIVFVAQNIAAMIGHKGFVDFPQNSVMLMAAVMAGKVAQSFAERK